MSTKFKRILALLSIGLLFGVGLTACKSDADVASKNISKDADNFKVLRRVVFYNTHIGQYMLEVEGYCSIGNEDKPNEVSITCKTATKGKDGATQDEYKKHFLGLSQEVTYFAEQLEGANVSTKHYKVVLKPEQIIADVEVR